MAEHGRLFSASDFSIELKIKYPVENHHSFSTNHQLHPPNLVHSRKKGGRVLDGQDRNTTFRYSLMPKAGSCRPKLPAIKNGEKEGDLRSISLQLSFRNKIIACVENYRTHP